MGTVAKIVLVLMLVSFATPSLAGGFHHHHHRRHWGGHGHHSDYGALLGAVGAGVLVYTVGRIHGSRAHQRRNDSPAPVAYPADGQSHDAQDRDRYECHRWAVGESDFDPSRDRRGDRDLYNRALTACLEARGYVVR